MNVNQISADCGMTSGKFKSDVKWMVDSMTPSSDYSNEIFYLFLLKKIELANGIGKRHTKLDFSNLVSLINGMLTNQKGMGYYSLIIISFFLFAPLVGFFTFLILISPVIMAMRIFITLYKCRADTQHSNFGDFAVVRSFASNVKLQKVKSRFGFSMFSISKSFDSCGVIIKSIPLMKIFVRLPLIPVMLFRDFVLLCVDINRNMGWQYTAFTLAYYFLRVLDKVYFEFILEIAISSREKCLNIYTGNKEDRYAMVERRLSRKYGKKLICIPHGLEFGFAFPQGVAGDLFYSTSEKAKQVMQIIYGDKFNNIFLYDEEINFLIYNIQRSPSPLKSSKVVFFTEAQEVEKNIEIIKSLQRIAVDFNVKLHPKDKVSNYDGYKLCFLDESDILVGNICLARKSTILIEALYNESYSISVLFDLRDRFYSFNFFPSLVTDKIKVVYNEKQLSDTLKALR